MTSKLRPHIWTRIMVGGDPAADASSHEYVQRCSICGIEDDGDPLLPLCPGDEELGFQKPEAPENKWRLFCDWDWQRFLIGVSFARRREDGESGYFALNLGFLRIFTAKCRWSPWLS